jgi:hypothetical protein
MQWVMGLAPHAGFTILCIVAKNGSKDKGQGTGTRTWFELLTRSLAGREQYVEISRERATQRGRVLTSSVGLWEGPLGVRITQCPYLGSST